MSQYSFGLWKKQRHSARTTLCFLTSHVHLVFVAKYRRSIRLQQLSTGCANCLLARFAMTLRRNWSKWTAERDHVHLLVGYPPKVRYQLWLMFERRIQSRAAERKAGHRQTLLQRGRCGRLPTSASSCGGAPISIIRQYIEQQEAPT
ncbi:MAG: transposase [Burkholderiales bacterium]|nr:transposase [Burkholderiales bacterium]